MAKKKAAEKKLERTYVIHLRHEWIRAPKYRRAKRAVNGVKNFISQHMKIDIPSIKIGPKLNELIWLHGIRNPPGRIKVTAIKEAIEDKEFVKVELEGVAFKTIKPKAKVEAAPGLRGKLEKAIGAKKGAEESREEKLEELAEEEKETKKKEEDKILTEEKKITEDGESHKPFKEEVSTKEQIEKVRQK